MLKVYDGLPHGMIATHADLINADLLEFFQKHAPKGAAAGTLAHA